ncbi:hypothetical protein ACFL6E_01380 [Candidatus Neomarinimicrobiota bacterium]
MGKTYSAIIFIAIITLLTNGCGEDPQRHLDLGLWYFEKGLVDDAILEYKETIRLLPAEPRQLTREELNIVAAAHHSLAVAYAHKNWYELAQAEALLTFEMQPTEANFNLLDLVRQRARLEGQTDANSVSPY